MPSEGPVYEAEVTVAGHRLTTPTQTPLDPHLGGHVGDPTELTTLHESQATFDSNRISATVARMRRDYESTRRKSRARPAILRDCLIVGAWSPLPDVNEPGGHRTRPRLA